MADVELILLQRVDKLGQMGEVVRVKNGFARNFLLPQHKALRATEANKAKFEHMKVDLQAKNLESKGAADKIGKKLDGKSFPVIRQASDTGQLYGSVTPRDIAALLTESGFEVDRNQIALNVPIKTVGQHKVPVHLHPEVEVNVTVNVARSADEAERLAERVGGLSVMIIRQAGESGSLYGSVSSRHRRRLLGRRSDRGAQPGGAGTPDQAAGADPSARGAAPRGVDPGYRQRGAQPGGGREADPGRGDCPRWRRGRGRGDARPLGGAAAQRLNPARFARLWVID